MTSDELVENLEALPEEGLAEDAGAEATERYFIFSVGESRYALLPSAIHEIVSDVEVFPIPACPPYVPGLINSHGTPHTVFDLRVLFENERQEATQFLVLNLENDDVAFGCTEVDEIAEVPLSAVSTFAEKDAAARFCTAMLEISGQRIPVLAVDHILRKLESDLG